jgi:hypothetical protein
MAGIGVTVTREGCKGIRSDADTASDRFIKVLIARYYQNQHGLLMPIELALFVLACSS